MKKSEKKPKKTRRNQRKYPNLEPEYNLKTRSEQIDYDYIDKLKEVEKEWLNKFTKEYTNADLNSKNLSENLHNTKKLKKDCYDRNNARNRDTLSRAKASGSIVDYEELREKTAEPNEESSLLDQIDDDSINEE